jgi:hypothetical protein
VSETAARRKSKSRRPRARSKTGNGHTPEVHIAAAGSLTRTKALLLAALRVWELKHRVGE